MNVERRIAKIEALLGHVAQRQRNLQRMSSQQAAAGARLAGWNGMERNLQTALTSARAQLGRTETGVDSGRI